MTQDRPSSKVRARPRSQTRRTPRGEEAHTVVVKVGTSTLTAGGDDLDREVVASLVEQLCAVRSQNHRVVLVTSGAIRAGMAALGVNRARTMPEKQAAAAVGQGLLMRLYTDLFRQHDIVAAQILLTRDDIGSRHRYLDARNTVLTLLNQGVVPIVNENDTVATEEIRFGDNDTLAALVAMLIGADLLVVLSDVEGLMAPGDDGKPRLVERVTRIEPDLASLAGGPSSKFGTGGMASKVEAARMATRAGIPVIVAHGRRRNVIPDAVVGAAGGTYFEADRGLASRKRWIAFGRRMAGEVQVDEGAKDSLVKRGKSLLPAGIVAVRGNFQIGDVVKVADQNGEEFARGLSNYSAREVLKVRGLKTAQIRQVLGDWPFDEVIHRDNLVLDAAAAEA